MTGAEPGGDRKPRSGLLRIYLNDHLAALVGAQRLAHRVAGAQRGRPLGRDLALVAVQLDEDRTALLDAMRRLDVPARRAAAWLGAAGERAGRLKPNGYVVRRSPLSTLIELEALGIGLVHEAQMWHTLVGLARHDTRLDGESITARMRSVEHRTEVVHSARETAATVLTAP